MSKYKAGDLVRIKGRVRDMTRDSYRMSVGNNSIWVKEDNIEGYLYDTKAYSDGLADAWELARKINDMPNSKMQEIFDISEDVIEVGWELFNNFTPQQALAKIEDYEKSQQIEVGDVVKVKTDAGSEHIGVVTQITANQNCACIVYADGSTEMNTANNMTKTNKHLDIEHLLEQIRG